MLEGCRDEETRLKSRMVLRIKCTEINGVGRGHCEGEKKERNWEFFADALKA